MCLDPRKMEESTQKWLVIGGIIVAVIALFAFIIFSDKTITPTEADISKVKTEGNPVVGQAEAPVTIAYWSDYQCTFCKKFESDVVSNVMADYVDTGKVKIVYKDFAFIGEHSTIAAIAGRAVWEAAPEQFAPWHKAMFEKQDGENTGWGSKADILALTGSLGIDAAKVDQLMSSKASDYQKAIDADQAEGVSFGAGGTPSIIIGKQLIYGLTSYDNIKQLIDQQLGQTK